jgi:hypothetical protein
VHVEFRLDIFDASINLIDGFSLNHVFGWVFLRVFNGLFSIDLRYDGTKFI